jgi:hypothetical protein
MAGEPSEVLYRSARALRRLGARLTRYDLDEGTLEARARRLRVEVLVRVAVAADQPGATRLRIEGAPAAPGRLTFGATGWVVRRLRSEIDGRRGEWPL